MAIEVFTSIAANYLPKARVLAASVKRFHPEMRFHVVLVDKEPSSLRDSLKPFDSVILPSELGFPNYRQWLFQHSVVEASTGVKGLALVKLFAGADTDLVLYFDPDIVILHPLDELLRCLESGAILLTPHLSEPESDLEAIRDNELSVLKHGIYNLGFLGVRKCAEGRRFANWWADRLERFCYDDIPNGLFTDQRWADLAPAFFSGVHILRDPRYNVCTWNLTHRLIEGSLDRGLTVDGKPVVFYHFSGLDSGAQKAMLDKYGKAMPALYELRDWYLSECERFGAAEYAGLEWCYARFDNGHLIRPEHRKVYREREDVRTAFPNPFRTAPVSESFYHWHAAEYASQIQPAARDNTTLRSILYSGSDANARPRQTNQQTYRIIVWPTSVQLSGVVAAVREIQRKSYRRDALVIVCRRSVLDDLRATMEPETKCAYFVLNDERGDDDLFGELLAEFAEQDLLIVRPPVDLPDLWDVRLAWAAYRQEGVASVSPVGDGWPDTTLSAAGAAGQQEGTLPVDHQTLDELCYRYSTFGLSEVESPNPSCVFLRAAAAQESMAAGSIRSFQDFVAQTKRLRWAHVLADHLYIGQQPAPPPLSASSPSQALVSLRLAVRDHILGRRSVRLRNIRDAVRPRRLHIMHSWGGGLERWVQEFARADASHINLLLKSVGEWGAFGQELHLFRSAEDKEPLRRYPLTPAIKGTAIQHSVYDKTLTEITVDYGVDSLIVSSLIGHSLDVLRANLTKVMVCHDYYPFCPALNVTFGSVCTSCTRSELGTCLVGNPNNSFFRNVPAEECLELRERFLDIVGQGCIPMVAPSESVRVNYERLAPQLGGSFHVIPHGTAPLSASVASRHYDDEEPLRVLVLGRLSAHKGLGLLREVIGVLEGFAELYLIGAGEAGQEFQGRTRVFVVPEFQRESLPEIIERIKPHAGLLLSVVQETFSYTLQEMFEFAIPVIATRVGSFVDRIREGENGFLVEPEANAVAKVLAQLAGDRSALRRMHQSMLGQRPRNAEEMVADYVNLLAMPAVSERAYFGRALEPDEETIFDRCTCWWGGLTGELNLADATTIRYPIGDEAQFVRLNIPERADPATVFGLSLMTGEGFVLLHGFRLFEHRGECICYSDARQGTIELILTAAKGFPWAADSGLLVYAYRQNPQIVLRLPDYAVHQMRGGGYLECDFTRLPWSTAQSLVVTSVLAGKVDGASSPPVLAPSMERNDEELNRQLQSARERISDLEMSISWKITAPLRAARSAARRVMPLRRIERPGRR